ncbi:MAG: hypothetical protein JWM87_598 [Candidatus Eremiobacteraeota bacterium]|nr:hypothetical protein [Candidatus Eremiobacteraeota bacterium]
MMRASSISMEGNTGSMHLHVRSLLRACAAVVAPVVVALGFATAAPAFAAATPAGTAITNTATATYSDGTNTYNSQSNTVTTTVQNAPSMTIAPPQGTPGNNTVSPGGTVTDNYTLTNTGNAAGYFQLSGALGTANGVTAGQGNFSTFVVNAGAGNQSLATVAAVNNYLATGNAGGPFLTAINGTIAINVTYTAQAGASGTITTNVTANVTQPAGSGTTLQTSTPNTVGQYNDTVVADARMDLQKIAAVGGSVLAPTVQYTVRGNNGGSRAMAAVFRSGLPAGSYGAACPSNVACGVVLTDKIPSYNATQLTLNTAPSWVTQPTGAVFIYSTDGTNWTNSTVGAVYVGVFIPASAITGSFGASNPGSSQGSVTAGQAQVAFTYTINGSTAFGAANANAITNVVNSIYADQSGFIEGPGITLQSVTNNASATTANTAPAVANANGALTGAAGVTSAASPSSTSVLNGPNGFPGAVGPTNTNDDYTAVSYTNGGTILSAVNGATVTVPAAAAAITIVNSIQNPANKDDTYNLTAATGPGLTALPAGWTVTFQSAGQAASGSCGAVVAGTAITSVCVPSGATQNYRTLYTPPAGATTFNSFAAYGDAVTATSVNDNTKNNVTLDEIFVGGYVKLVKTLGVAAGQPCATATVFTPGAANVNPGECVQYTVTYTNVAPAGGTNNITLNATSFVITEDGAASGGGGATAYTNNWAANSNGLYAVPVDSSGGTLGGYNPGPGAAGSSRFTDTVGPLNAGASGNCTFKVQIK